MLNFLQTICCCLDGNLFSQFCFWEHCIISTSPWRGLRFHHETILMGPGDAGKIFSRSHQQHQSSYVFNDLEIRGCSKLRNLLSLPILSAHIKKETNTRQRCLIKTLPEAAIWQHREVIPGNINPQRAVSKVLPVIQCLSDWLWGGLLPSWLRNRESMAACTGSGCHAQMQAANTCTGGLCPGRLLQV